MFPAMTRPTRRHYRNSPIVEAVIDIQVQLGDVHGISKLTELADHLRGDFPTRLPVNVLQMGFDVQGSDTPAKFTNTQQQSGWRLNAKDQDRVILLQTVGFTYSHLPPYSDWETFSEEAKTIWTLYCDALAPVHAIRAAVRVINQIPVPSLEFEIDTYLNIYPKLPESIPTVASAMLMQLQLPMTHVDAAAKAVLNLATGQVMPPENKPSLILDIDLSVERKITIKDDLWSLIDQLGIVKDDIFEACITDKLREKIQ
jgi:uncharacterized protein (TIGR04255 family)